MNTKKFHDLLDFPGASPRLRGLATGFARQVNATWPNIAGIHPLPALVWQKAAEAGVTGIGIDQAHTGQGGNYGDICACAAEISFYTQSPGLGLCLLIHQLIARFSIGTLASVQQKEQYLPQLAAGSMTAAHAISEPETGASLKHMKSRAERHGDHWLLTGEKTYVTNGPIAGLFVTLVVTGEANGRKAFSAFLVPAASEGVQVRDIGPLPFLRPAPHGAASFNKVKLSQGNMLGEEGKAVDFLSRGFVALEDVLMAGFLAGGFAGLFMCLCRDVVRAGHNTLEKQRLAGRLQAGLTAFTSLTAYAADRTSASYFLQKSQGISQGIRELSLFNLSLFRELAQNVPLAHDTKTLLTDLEKSLTIRGYLAALREEKAGREFLPG